jgi:hypothetical protein
MHSVFYAKKPLHSVVRKIKETGGVIHADVYQNEGYIIASSMDSAISILSQDRGGSRAILIIFCAPQERKRIKRLKNLPNKLCKIQINPLKSIRFNPSKSAFISSLIKDTLSLDLVSLMQSVLYNAAPKQKRKKCRTELITWIQNPDKPINEFLIEKGFKAVADDIANSLEKWRLAARPDIKGFLKSIKGKNKAQIISLGEGFGLSSFESITLSQWN